jgi:hypothetical protein
MAHPIKLTRRGFTIGVGASLLAAPFLRLLPLPAQAAPTAKKAKKLVVFFHPNGTVHKHWRPQGTESSFRFEAGSILEPAAAIKDDLMILDGINFVGFDNHEGGMRGMLTGGGRASHESQGMSLDVFVASKLGQGAPFSHVNLGALTSAWGGNVQTRMSYTAPDEHVPPNDDPKNAFDKLFASVTGSQAEIDAITLAKKSILDTVRGDLAMLRAQLGQEERAKLDRHLDALRELEKNIQAFVGGDGSCTPPQIAQMSRTESQKNDNFPTVIDLQIKIMVAALACDLTHVTSLQCSHTVSPVQFSWLNIADGHHSLSHIGDQDAAGVGRFVQTERWFTEQFVKLVQAMKDTPSADGSGTLFDQSLIFWPKEMGDGRLHNCIAVPFVVTGGGTDWKRGRYIRFKDEPHQKLLVSLCQGLDIPVSTFGDPMRSSGPLTGLAG